MSIYTALAALALAAVGFFILRRVARSGKVGVLPPESQPVEFDDDDPIPVVKVKHNQDVETWFISWLAHVRRVDKNSISSFTPVSFSEVRAATMVATMEFGGCYLMNSHDTKTVGDFVKSLKRQMAKTG